MKILLLGASGGTGRALISQALPRGHEVTAVVRDPGAFGPREPRLELVPGDVLAGPDVVAGRVAGHDAVVSALGVHASLTSGDLIARTMEALVPAMEARGVGRLLVVSAFGVGESRRDASLPQRILYRLLLGDVFADKLRGEERIAASSLRYTLVYPVLLTNGPRTERYETGERLPMRGIPKVSRADVAHFLLSELEAPVNVRRRVVIRSA